MNTLDLPSITATGRPIVIDPTDAARPYLDDRRDGCVSRWLAHRLAKSASPGLWYASPLILVLLVGFVAPLFCVVWFSFMPERTFSLFGTPTFSNYTQIFGQTYYRSLFWSLGLGALTTAILLVICYPLAFALAKVFKRFATFVTIGITLSLFVSENIRLFGWVLGLMKGGVIGGLLGTLGLPYASPLYDVGVIVLGLVYVYLPFMLFPLILGIQMVPDQVREAAFDLGASRWRVFREIDVPLSMPGIVIGSMLTFVLAVGAMAEAKILGGQKVVTIAAEIETAFTYAQNWPLGSGLSTLLIGIVGTIVFLTLRKFDPETLLGNKS
ncbi:MAG TPA: ABC transporter permease [Opitutaceae bacterium]|nr:ABC transporter permease [Opitutaceae bacterium]HOD47129.1 ABC transporter permease [Opitutaceae bacterium]HOY54786.1 ABC transporter permease [Opitutaceae bacterium]HPG17222.1 ABC transporter permease [Opitutaceae bacterium]HPN99757.1 ABC transporter permease [Opitutaceae bacterium]